VQAALLELRSTKAFSIQVTMALLLKYWIFQDICLLISMRWPELSTPYGPHLCCFHCFLDWNFGNERTLVKPASALLSRCTVYWLS